MNVHIVVGSCKEQVVESALSQKYDQSELHLMTKDKTTPQFFNSVYHTVVVARKRIRAKSHPDIFILLDDYNWLAAPDSVEQIVNKLNRPSVNFVYSDSFFLCQDNSLIHEYLPSFNPRFILNKQTILNVGFAIKENVFQPFNENIQHLYFWEAMRRIANKTVLTHIAEPLFCRQYLSANIEQEAKLVNEL
jgi:hypothetical protein